MVKELATTMMLIGAIAPYKEAIQNINTTKIALQNSNKWNITNNTIELYTKNQLIKTLVYENSVIKVQQLKITYFEETEQSERQIVDSYFFTTLTLKQENINDYTYKTTGNTQQMLDAYRSLNAEIGSLSYEFYKLEQNINNENEINALFNLNSYDYTTIDNAQAVIEGQGTELDTDDTRDAISKYGNNRYADYHITGPKTYIFMEYVQINTYFGDDVNVWPRQYNFFYTQPTQTEFEYSWIINPDTVGNYEVIDVGNLFLTILGMPMAWITQAFNFTLWPGTPYAINVGHILSAVIVASVIIIIIKKVYK